MKYIALFLLACGILSCSTLKVTYDYDKTVDFAKYKTYAFSSNALKLPVQDLDRDRILRAVETEMAAEGFTKSDKPDVWIDLNVRLDQKVQANATTMHDGMYGPWGYGYGPGFSTTQVDYYEYVDGTLFINMVDSGTEKIVWQGRGTKTLNEDASSETRENNVNYAVKQIYLKYPPLK